MKNKILIAIMIGLIVICTGCATVEEIPDRTSTSMFVKVGDADTFSVIYHRKTKVMYAVSRAPHSYGNLTLLVNPDGSPMLYEEEK